MTRQELFLAELALVDRVIGWVCARRGLRGADAEDFAQAAKTRLIENDYEVLAKFAGRSSLKTYLTSVVSRMYLDFQVQRFGKWRPSAEARRLGAVGLRLEQLLHRDGLTLEEACGVLLSDPRVQTTREALAAMSQRLPRRPSRKPAAAAAAIEQPTLEGGAEELERAERQALADRIFRVIRRSLSQLPARDRLFMRLNLQSGLTVADVSRALGLDQKALYRKREDIHRRLRADIEAEGIRVQDVQELLDVLDWDAALALDEPRGPEPPAPGPSQAVGRTPRPETQP